MKTQVVAVLDVGKTNKKVLLYDRAYQVQAETRTAFDPRECNGLEVEATDELLAWFKDALKTFARDYDIRAISVSAHGATCALLDAQGALAHPVVSYTCPKGAEVQDEFYAKYGDRKTVLRETASADVGFANIAKMFYYFQTRLPEVWATVEHALFYNTYLGYELTGVMANELTYLGNHNCFWDFEAQTWSRIGKDLGADTLFPEKMLKPWETLGPLKPEIAEACGLSPDCLVACGLHDSNANFLPYLAQGHDDFILNSTGTWCVAMKRAASRSLTGAEIAANLFFNMDATGWPVLTALFPGGMEYDKFSKFSTLSDESTAALMNEVVAARNCFVVPGALPSAKVFVEAEPKVVDRDARYDLAQLEAGAVPIDAMGQRYFAALNLGLAIGSAEMMRRLSAAPGCKVFIEGGFANNLPYCQALAALCPGITIALTNMKEGTSFGAALAGWILAEGLSLEAAGQEFTIAVDPVAPAVEGDLAAYEAAWRAVL